MDYLENSSTLPLGRLMHHLEEFNSVYPTRLVTSEVRLLLTEHLNALPAS